MTHQPGYLYWPPLLTLVAFFSLGLIANKMVNFSFYLLVFICLTTLLLRHGAIPDFLRTGKKYWPINLAMFGMLSAVLINQLSTGIIKARLIDYPSRLAFFVFFFWMLLQIPARTLKLTKWGWISGAIFCTIQLYLMDKDSNGRPTMMVWYIELMMLLGVFTLISIAWNSPKNKPVFIVQTCLQIIAGAGIFYSAYLSETRGIWIAMPVFLLLLFAALNKNWCSRKNFIIGIAIICALGLAFSTTNIVTKRIHDAQKDIQLYTKKENTDTSIGTRFQVWHGAWILFTENPIFGVGKEQYAQAMQSLADRKIITPAAAQIPHSHNEILYNMMTLGVVGLTGILLLYLVPAYYFAKELRHSDREIRASAAMGLSVCLGYLIFGLVDVMLLYKATDVFYCFAVALFFAHIVTKKKELASSE